MHHETAALKDHSVQATIPAEPASACPKQFNFARHWRKKIAPLLKDPEVGMALAFGMCLSDMTYRPGDPPWLFGSGRWEGQRARKGCLSWHQPRGKCHYIAPFCWALARKLFPNLQWGFLAGDYHTVVIGWMDDWKNPLWVMDILLFRQRTAQQSLELAKVKRWRFYPSMAEYAASFCDNPEVAVKTFRDVVEASLEVANG
jgi:hypothetical protein